MTNRLVNEGKRALAVAMRDAVRTAEKHCNIN